VTWRKRLAGLRLDTTPLRESRDFRLLFGGGAVFYVGNMVSYVAVPYQLYHLTGSNFAVGALGIVELVPLVFFGLYGGALADHADRRTMLLVTGGAQAALTAVLVVNATFAQPRVWLIYTTGALLAAAQSLQRPSREALVPRTVKHSQLTAATAITSLGRDGSVLVGPAIGGVLIQVVGVAWCYLVDVTGLLAALVLFALMRAYPPTEQSTPPSLAGIMDGLRYALHRRDLLGTYVVDIVAMLMAMPIVLFPALATHVFHRPDMLGLFYSAESVGSLLVTVTSGWTSRVHSHGRAVVLAAGVWGAAIAVMGLAPNVWSVLPLSHDRRWRRHGERRLPRHDLESDDPRFDARTPCRHRDAVLQSRSARRAGAVGPRRGRLERAWRHHERRTVVRRWGGRHSRGTQGFLVVRRAHRRVRRPRAVGPAGSGVRPRPPNRPCSVSVRRLVRRCARDPTAHWARCGQALRAGR
jgi:MFS family permease